MKIAIIDGQGGGIGKAIISKMREELDSSIELIALGTNSSATSLMLKAGANKGATGENAIAFNIPSADIIIGSIGIITANSFMGELTPKMAAAISAAQAKKVFIPLNNNNIYIAGNVDKPLPRYIDDAIKLIKEERW